MSPVANQFLSFQGSLTKNVYLIIYYKTESHLGRVAFISVVTPFVFLRTPHKIAASDFYFDLSTGNNYRFAFVRYCILGLLGCHTKINMSSSTDVHVRICGQEIIKYDLEIKALIQVRTKTRLLILDLFVFMLVSVLFCKRSIRGLQVAQREANVS